MPQLLSELGHSEFVSVDPSKDEDFHDWDKFLNNFYSTFTGKIKKNHIFHVSHEKMRKGNQIQVELRESNLEEDKMSYHNAVKRDFATRKKYQMNPTGLKEAVMKRPMDIRQARATLLHRLESPGMNIYKQVEMFKNYRPLVPVEFHDDPVYAEPEEEIKAAVREEKSTQKRNREEINANKRRVKKKLLLKQLDEME